MVKTDNNATEFRRAARPSGCLRSNPQPTPSISGSMNQNTELFTDLPPDILFQIFSECDVLGILNLSSVRG